MAKVKRDQFGLSGKLGDNVHVDNRKSGPYVRKATPAKSKKRLAVLKKQNRRNSFLNNLASELNNIMREYVDSFKPTTFYQSVLARFRKEPLDNRFLVLHQLKGMEINPEYPLSKIGLCNATVNVLKNKIIVAVIPTTHPRPGRHKANTYYYEAILLQWTKRKKAAVFDSLGTPWIPLNGEFKTYTLPFNKPDGTVHWLLCLRGQLCIGEDDITTYATQGVQIVDVGTLDKKEEVMLEKQEVKEEKMVGKKRRVVKRVEGKEKG